MKRLLVGLSLIAAACSSQAPVNPSGATTETQASVLSETPAADPAADGVGVDPTPPAPGANAATPQYTLTKPAAAPKPDNPNCYVVPADALEWVLNITDAGPSHLRFVVFAFQDEQPGCAPTTKNGRGRLTVSGVTDYTPHSRGETRFKFDPKTGVPVDFCGRVQVDVSIFDLTGTEILIVGVVVDYGTVCSPKPPLCLAPTGGPFVPGALVTFTVQDPEPGKTYTWSAPEGSPASGSGLSFTTTRTTDGLLVVKLTDSAGVDRSGTACQASFGSPSVLFSCSAPAGTVAVGQSVAITATLSRVGVTPPGTPPTGPVTWQNLDDGTPVSGTTGWASTTVSGQTTVSVSGPFSSSFATQGSKRVRATWAGGGTTHTADCAVAVQTVSLRCEPTTQTAGGINIPVSMAAILTTPLGGTPSGLATWTGDTGTVPSGTTTAWGPATPVGSASQEFRTTLSTSFATAGTKTVTVTVPGTAATATCAVVVPSSSQYVCSPAAVASLPAGTPQTFTVVPATPGGPAVPPGTSYTWTITPAGYTLVPPPTATSITASFAPPPAGTAPITYTITPSGPNLVPGTTCMVTVPPISSLCPPEPLIVPTSGGPGTGVHVAGGTYWKAILWGAPTRDFYDNDLLDPAGAAEWTPPFPQTGRKAKEYRGVVCAAVHPPEDIHNLIDNVQVYIVKDLNPGYNFCTHPDRYWWLTVHVNATQPVDPFAVCDPHNPPGTCSNLPQVQAVTTNAQGRVYKSALLDKITVCAP